MSIYAPGHPKVITFDQAATLIARAKRTGQNVVLAQGVFDVIHIGHTTFLREAKAAGDLLFVGLEPDESAKMNKGSSRPLNAIDERLQVIAELASVDYVFAFDRAIPYGQTGSAAYAARTARLRPSTLALALGDSLLAIRSRQAEELGIKVAVVKGVWREYSTTRLLQAIGKA